MKGILHERLARTLLAAGLLFAAIATATVAANGRSGAPPGTISSLPGAQEPFELEGQAAPTSFSLKGRIVPQRWVNLSFSNGGRVAELRVEEGQTVPEGMALASLEGTEAGAALVDAARFELLAARQAIDALHQEAAVLLAEAESLLAESREVQDQASWRVRKLKEPPSPLRVEQTYANMHLAEQKLEQARHDLEKAEILWNNRRDPAWYFLSRREFRLNLALLSQHVAQAERQYVDAVQKYEDLLEPVDEIDLLQAEAELRVADAQVEAAMRERDKFMLGPRAEDLQQAEARLVAADKALQAAEKSLAQREITAPFAGTLVSIPGRAGQWANAGEVILVLAELTGWMVEIEELKESELTLLEAGMPVSLRLDALPGLALEGKVESIGLVYLEKDGEVLYSALVSLSGDPDGLRWGMTARIEPLAFPSTGNPFDG